MTYNLTWLAAVPTGWRPILHEAVEQLHGIDPTSRIVQVKEKFGSLRLHVDHGSAEAYAAVQAACTASESICELCGADARLLGTPEGYYSTRCPDHASGFMPLEEAPNVTFRAVAKRDRCDPAVDHDGEISDDGGAR